MRQEWTGAKRIVVKIGSSLLVDAATGALRQEWLAALADDIAGLRKEGKEAIIVSSGAIALGRNALKLPKGALKLEDSQAAAWWDCLTDDTPVEVPDDDRPMPEDDALLSNGSRDKHGIPLRLKGPIGLDDAKDEVYRFLELSTPCPAFKAVYDKEIPGFGELFRQLSYELIQSSTMQSRTTGGVAGGTYLFALPGSPGACRDGWEKILKYQLDIRWRPCNLVELMPRLTERERAAPKRGTA